MRCPFCKTILAPDAESCHVCGKEIPAGQEPDALSEMAALKSLLARMRGGLDGDLRSLERRLDEDFRTVAEKLEDLESRLLAAAASEPEPNRESVAEAFSPVAAMAIPATTVAATEPIRNGLPHISEGPTLGAAQSPPPIPPPPPAAKPKHVDGMAELRFGQKWLLIVGVAITVLGVGYFLKYSFDQNWIGEAGRVALAYLAGVLCLGAGEAFRRFEMYRGFGFALMGGGIAILYFSGFAAFQIYGLVGQPVAFGLLVLVTLLAGMLSYVHNAQWLAILGLVGGFVTPIALSTGVDNQVGLMTYMAVLNLAVLGLARVRAWRLLTMLAFLLTWVVFSGWFAMYYTFEKFWLTTLYLNLFYIIHFLAPVAYYLRREGQISALGFSTALPNAFIAFGYSHFMISHYSSTEHVGIVTLAYAFMAALLASWLYRRQITDRRPFVMLLVQGLLFLVITVPVVFSLHWITVFWAAQAALLMWASRRLDNTKIGFGAAVLLAVALGKLYAYDYTEVFGLDYDRRYNPEFAAMVIERWLTVAVALASLAATAIWLPLAWRRHRALFLGLFVLLLFASLNLETDAYFGEKAPTARFAALSVLWGLYAVALLIIGFFRNSAALRKTGIGLFGITVVKVFLVDMANVSTPFRIISFVVLGVLLIGASFLYYYYKDRILRAVAGEQPASEEDKKQ